MKQRVDKTKSGIKQGYDDVTMCNEWRDFDTFLEDLGERPSKSHTLDRVDNTKGYIKGNVKWSTKEEQGRNKSNNVMIEGLTLVEWCEARSWRYGTVWSWLRRSNHSVETIKEKGELKWAKDQILNE
tara:strand:+ start:161 stop:541 length:381 start_codon:yes stop_codon:yes gene_type:complete